jgi:hypothetical protein
MRMLMVHRMVLDHLMPVVVVVPVVVLRGIGKCQGTRCQRQHHRSHDRSLHIQISSTGKEWQETCRSLAQGT